MDNSFSDPLLLENQLCFPLYACAKELIRRCREPLEPLGLTYTQYIVMLALWERGSLTEGELGKILYLDSGTLAPLLKRLEGHGLLRRSRPAGNERKLLIELSEVGKSMRSAAKVVPCAIRDCIPLSEDELSQLGILLQKALTRMRNDKQQEETSWKSRQ